jgi:hypothetical protein
MHPNPTLESRLECYGGGYDLRVAIALRDLHVRRFVAFVAPEIESEATLAQASRHCRRRLLAPLTCRIVAVTRTSEKPDPAASTTVCGMLHPISRAVLTARIGREGPRLDMVGVEPLPWRLRFVHAGASAAYFQASAPAQGGRWHSVTSHRWSTVMPRRIDPYTRRQTTR